MAPNTTPNSGEVALMTAASPPAIIVCPVTISMKGNDVVEDRQPDDGRPLLAAGGEGYPEDEMQRQQRATAITTRAMMMTGGVQSLTAMAMNR